MVHVTYEVWKRSNGIMVVRNSGFFESREAARKVLEGIWEKENYKVFIF